MKCYYHDNREAVATCKCGKCLCRECADAHTPIMCSSCWSANQKELQKEIETNRVLIKRNEENAKKNIRNQLQSRLSLYLQYIQ